MQRLPLTHYQSNLMQRLACGVCTVALVGSLAVYQRAVLANPLIILQRHLEAIAAQSPGRATVQYSSDAILLREHGALDEVYQGTDIYDAWQKFFDQYQIQNYQLQNHQIVQQSVGDRVVTAEVTMTAKPQNGSVVVLSFFYQAHVDSQGKITYEVWRTNPGLNV